MPYQFLADAVLTLHVGLVVFVVGGLAAIVAGNLSGWRWVNRLWWRSAHLAAIAVVAGEAWFGAACPITVLEMALRSRARESTYGGSFVEHWLQRLLYYEAPPWVFVLAYSLFALAVLGAWWRWPPRPRRRSGAR
jgi:polyferredoxin